MSLGNGALRCGVSLEWLLFLRGGVLPSLPMSLLHPFSVYKKGNSTYLRSDLFSGRRDRKVYFFLKTFSEGQRSRGLLSFS